MVDGGKRVVDVLQVEQPDLEVRFGRLVAPPVDDLEEGVERFLLPAGLEQGLALAIGGLIQFGRGGSPLAVAAACHAQNQPAQQQERQKAEDDGGAGHSWK